MMEVLLVSRIRLILLSLLAVFAVSAVASASASALLWWVCLSGTGATEYENNKCEKKQKAVVGLFYSYSPWVCS